MTTIRSVKINPTETITTMNLTPSSIGADISAAIGCSMFDVVGLADNIDLFVDDEGLINGSPLNLPATVLAHLFDSPTVIFGTAIAVSVTPDGETIGLTDRSLVDIEDSPQAECRQKWSRGRRERRRRHRHSDTPIDVQPGHNPDRVHYYPAAG